MPQNMQMEMAKKQIFVVLTLGLILYGMEKITKPRPDLKSVIII